MAEENGKRAADQLKYLLDHTPRFSFYQAISWLERIFRRAPALGQEGPAALERVRLRPSFSLSFPVADLESAELQPEKERVTLTTTFLGLYGSDSPLPYAYAEHLAKISAEPQGERVRTFLDIFHHRLLSLLYRAWRKYRPGIQGGTEIDPLYSRVLSSIGYDRSMGLGGESPPRLSEARLQVLRHRSASGLQFLLQKRLGFPVSILQLVQRRVPIPYDQLAMLGLGNCVLGISLVIGTRVQDCNKIRIRIQASDFAMYMRLLPGRPALQNIEEVMGSYMRFPMDHDVEVRLAQDRVPPWQLGAPDLLLGFSLWLGRPPHEVARRWTTQRALAGL